MSWKLGDETYSNFDMLHVYRAISLFYSTHCKKMKILKNLCNLQFIYNYIWNFNKSWLIEYKLFMLKWRLSVIRRIHIWVLETSWCKEMILINLFNWFKNSSFSQFQSFRVKKSGILKFWNYSNNSNNWSTIFIGLRIWFITYYCPAFVLDQMMNSSCIWWRNHYKNVITFYRQRTS